jgi:hypothetical protein
MAAVASWYVHRMADDTGEEPIRLLITRVSGDGGFR